MKKILLYIGIALAAIGCAKSEIIEYTPTDGEISFSAGVTTRVSSDNDCAWVLGEEIGIFTDNLADKGNLKFTINDISTGAMTNGSGEALFPLIDDTRTYYAYHPYSSSQDDTTKIAIDCTSQSSISPLLWATTSSNEIAVSLTFSHQYAKVLFNLTPGGAETTSLTSATAWLTGANSKGEFDIESGEFTISGTDKITLEIDKSDNTITAYLPPMEDDNTEDDVDSSVKSNVRLWVNDGSNTFVYSFATEKWESGNTYEYDITVGTADIELIENVYYISSAAGLKAFADLVNGVENSTAITVGGITFSTIANPSISGVLTRDIDLSTICYEGENDDGVNWTPIGSFANNFKGTFDGGGYEVNNLYINATDTDYRGLFGFIYGAAISNLGVTGSVSGSKYNGGLVGESYNSTISYCYNRAKVSSVIGYTGGVAGYNQRGSTITSCYNTGDVSGGSSEYAGGVVGSNYNDATISSCYNTGDVSGTDHVGGVSGNNHSSCKITSSYSTGAVNGTQHVGGVVGSNLYSSTVTSSYWNIDFYSGDGVGLYDSVTTTSSYTTTIMNNSEYIPNTSYYFYQLLNENSAEYNSSNPTIKACAWIMESGLYPMLDFDTVATE